MQTYRYRYVYIYIVKAKLTPVSSSVRNTKVYRGELTFNPQEHCLQFNAKQSEHCSDVIMGTIASQITSLTIVYSSVYSGADQRKHQTSTSLAFVRGIHRWPVNSPHKWSVTQKMFPFDDVIMIIFPSIELFWNVYSKHLHIHKTQHKTHAQYVDGTTGFNVIPLNSKICQISMVTHITGNIFNI